MRFTTEITKYGEFKWRKRFAFLPVMVSEDLLKGVRTRVWLEFYERRYKYCGDGYGWLKTNECREVQKDGVRG